MFGASDHACGVRCDRLALGRAVNEMQLFHRFHKGTGGFRVVDAIESWWKMPVELKEAMLKKWQAEDKNKAKK